jgi:hypothetical protein
MKGLEPSTFCMARSRHRGRGDDWRRQSPPRPGNQRGRRLRASPVGADEAKKEAKTLASYLRIEGGSSGRAGGRAAQLLRCRGGCGATSETIQALALDDERSQASG